MLFKWLDTTEATQAGTALADAFYLRTSSSGRARPGREGGGQELQKFFQRFLQEVDRAARPLSLNVLKRAKLANSFKWRLLDRGLAPQLVDELTKALVQRLLGEKAGATAAEPAFLGSKHNGATRNGTQALHMRGKAALARGAYSDALQHYEGLVHLEPRDAEARSGLGATLAYLGRYQEAADQFRRAVGIKPSFAEACFNLGSVLQVMGLHAEAQEPLRRALKLKPSYVEARVALGLSWVVLGRLPKARDCYEKALRAAPRDTRAIVGMGQVASLEGRFADAEGEFRRALEIEPRASCALAALPWLRKMTPADADWAKRAEEIAGSGLTLIDESVLRFAIGKYYDDIGDFTRAFRAYRRANELHKLRAEPYDREGYTRFIDAVIQARTPEAIASARVTGSDSELPVFVLGMPRSGTSLVEQIIASHPQAHGAGEIDFWQSVVRRNAVTFWKSLPTDSVRRELARSYLKILTGYSADALRVVDKTPINATYLGIIHTTFPKARIIFMRRDPIDTCLSCYFQQFLPTMNWSTDLGDLAHYYHQTQRVAAHWHRVLPPGTILDVSYEDLVADQEKWTRRIIEFVGLPWDDRCLQFHKTARVVSTASAWQVRQKIYGSSVGRWRHYEKFIGPLKALADLPG